jgi:parallel beta-helix repeat protein
VNGPSVFERNEIRDEGCTLGIFGGDAEFHRVGAGEPTFRDNDISLETAAIRLQSSTTRPVFEGNYIHDMPKGLSLEAGARALFIDNEMIAIGNGIWVDSESSVELTGNTISESRLGVMIAGGPSTLTGNTISGTDLGINIYGEAEATLRDNTVCDNEVNVQVRGDANADIDDSNEICEDDPAA